MLARFRNWLHFAHLKYGACVFIFREQDQNTGVPAQLATFVVCFCLSTSGLCIFIVVCFCPLTSEDESKTAQSCNEEGSSSFSLLIHLFHHPMVVCRFRKRLSSAL